MRSSIPANSDTQTHRQRTHTHVRIRILGLPRASSGRQKLHLLKFLNEPILRMCLSVILFQMKGIIVPRSCALANSNFDIAASTMSSPEVSTNAGILTHPIILPFNSSERMLHKKAWDLESLSDAAVCMIRWASCGSLSSLPIATR